LYHCSQFKTDYCDMKPKNISHRSGQILSHFNEMGQYCFNYREVLAAFPNIKKGAILQLLSDMTSRGLLMRLREGIYYIIPYEEDAETFMPDWHLVAEHLVTKTDHYIGYYSALQIHNLITQPSLKEQIVVARQIRPSEMTIKNVPFQFIYHNEKHFFGARKIWIDNFNKVLCSDLEKTIVDCLFKPEYAGGLVEIAKAIYLSKDTIRFDTLLEYIKRFDSQAVIKRTGFLLETMDISNNITGKLHKLKTTSYVIADTELPKRGKRISRWSIQQNIDTDTIISSIST